jgi:Lar family restriction alleviation protein
MTPTPTALLPCPFCGHAESHIRKLLRDGYEKFKDDPDAYAYTVACHGCAAEGGWAKSETGARRCWNQRASSSVSVPSGESQTHVNYDGIVAALNCLADEAESHGDFVFGYAIREAAKDSSATRASVEAQELATRLDDELRQIDVHLRTLLDGGSHPDATQDAYNAASAIASLWHARLKYRASVSGSERPTPQPAVSEEAQDDPREASYITKQARAGTAFPRDQWGDDDHTVIWWNEESGDTMLGYLDDVEEYERDHPLIKPGFYTHFTRIVNPVFPVRSPEVPSV